MKVYNPITKMIEDKSKSIKAKDSKEDERKSYYYKGYTIVNDNKKGTWKALKDGKFIAEAATDKELEEILSNIKTKDVDALKSIREYYNNEVNKIINKLNKNEISKEDAKFLIDKKYKTCMKDLHDEIVSLTNDLNKSKEKFLKSIR